MVSAFFKWLTIFVACIILQTALVPTIAINGIAPDLIIIALFTCALRFGMLPATIIGFFLGLGIDLYSPSILGQHALAKTIIGCCMGIFNERFMRTDLIVKLIILALALLLHDTVFTLVTLVKTDQPLTRLFAELFVSTLPRTLYTLVFALLLFIRGTLFQLLFRR